MSLGELPYPGIESASSVAPALLADSLPLSPRGSSALLSKFLLMQQQISVAWEAEPGLSKGERLLDATEPCVLPGSSRRWIPLATRQTRESKRALLAFCNLPPTKQQARFLLRCSLPCLDIFNVLSLQATLHSCHHPLELAPGRSRLRIPATCYTPENTLPLPNPLSGQASLLLTLTFRACCFFSSPPPINRGQSSLTVPLAGLGQLLLG